MKFKNGDYVRYKVGNIYHYGQVTIAQEDQCKVMFNEENDPDYWYYPNERLELMVQVDTEEEKS